MTAPDDLQCAFPWAPPHFEEPAEPEEPTDAPAPTLSSLDTLRVTRGMRHGAKLAGIDPRDDAAVRRWHRDASRQVAMALASGELESAREP